MPTATPLAWYQGRLARVVAARAIGENLADAYDTGGAFFADPFKPSVIPETPSSYTAEGLPVGGAVYLFDEMRGDTARKIPWVQVKEAEADNLERMDTQAQYVAVNLEIRVRVGLPTGATPDPATGKNLIQLQAESLCEACAWCVCVHAGLLAREADADGAYGLVTFAKTVPARIDNSAANNAEGVGTVYVDATATVTISQRQFYSPGTPGV